MPDSPQPALTSTGDDARDEVSIPRPPDQMGAQGNGSQRFTVSSNNHPFGGGFGRWISCLVVLSIGHPLIHPFQIVSVKNHTRCTGINQPRNAKSPAGSNDILRSCDIGL